MNCQERIKIHQEWILGQPGLGHLILYLKDYALTFNLQYKEPNYQVYTTLRDRDSLNLIQAITHSLKDFPRQFELSKSRGYWSFPSETNVTLTLEGFQTIQNWLGA